MFGAGNPARSVRMNKTDPFRQRDEPLSGTNERGRALTWHCSNEKGPLEERPFVHLERETQRARCG